MPCLADVTRPVAQNIKDVCDRTIVPAYVDSIADLHVDGTGTVTFLFSYTDCAGHDSIWKFVYTLNPSVFTPKKNDTAYVHCISEITLPTLPVITNCGAPVDLTPAAGTSTLSGGCGDSTFVYTYEVNGTTYEWKYTYVVTPEPFTVPASQTVKVQCIAEVTQPTPPTVTNSCGAAITPNLTAIPAGIRQGTAAGGWGSGWPCASLSSGPTAGPSPFRTTSRPAPRLNLPCPGMR